MDNCTRSARNRFADDTPDRASMRRSDSRGLHRLVHAPNARFIPVWRSLYLLETGGGADPGRTVSMDLDSARTVQRAANSPSLGEPGADANHQPIQMDDDELEDAMWLGRAELREAIHAGRIKLPRATSIACQLIADWYDEGEEGAIADI